MRTLEDALRNAERLRREIPLLVQPGATCFDMVALADEVKLLGQQLSLADDANAALEQAILAKNAEIAALKAEIENMRGNVFKCASYQAFTL